MCAMTYDWARLSKALQAARKARGIGQVELGELVGVRRSAIQKIERGDMKKVTPTIRAIARVVGWTDDSVDRVLAGGEPELAEPKAPDEPEAEVAFLGRSDLSLRLVHDITSGGPLLDATVLPLADDDVELGHMVIVVRGKPDASPQAIRRALEEWERREMRLRGVADEAPEPPAVEEA